MPESSVKSELAGVDALSLLKRHGDALAEHLASLRHRYPDAPARLIESIEYSLMAGGKRLRPALVLECFKAAGGDNAGAAARKGALAGASALELIHTFSLVHDDLPAMDDDDLRRGRPTNHKVYGEAMAILAGDAMVTMAFELLATDCEPAIVPAMIRELAANSGPVGMIGGQVLDIDSENKVLSLDGLQQIHRMKTGALLTASCRLGVIAARKADFLPAITDFGRHLGLAFQIVDDVLDVTSTPEKLGKATNKDADRGKNTYPSLMGLDASRREAASQLEAGIDALRPLGQAADGLRSLARFVADRTV